MKTALPDNAKIAKEAKECMQECVSEFISFITSEGEWSSTKHHQQIIDPLTLHSIREMSSREKKDRQWRRYLICNDFTWLRKLFRSTQDLSCTLSRGMSYHWLLKRHHTANRSMTHADSSHRSCLQRRIELNEVLKSSSNFWILWMSKRTRRGSWERYINGLNMMSWSLSWLRIQDPFDVQRSCHGLFTR